MKKKVCILSHGLGNNGIDIFVRNVVTRLDQSKWDISLILALDDDGTLQPREPEVLEAGIPIYRTSDLGSIKCIPVHAMRLYRLLKELKTDVFHSNMDLLNGINCFVAWAAGVRVRIAHSHNYASRVEAKGGKSVITRIYRLVMRTLAELFSNRKFACSEPAMVYLFGENWKKKAHTYIINNGIDTARFSGKIRKEVAGARKIVSVGRLSVQKTPSSPWRSWTNCASFGRISFTNGSATANCGLRWRKPSGRRVLKPT